jgi:hypothetical protein
MIGTKRRAEVVGCSNAAVGERSSSGEAEAVSDRGAAGSEYPDISNDKNGQNPFRRKDKVSRARVVPPGLVGS